MGGGSGGSPDLRNPCPGAAAVVEAAFPVSGEAVGAGAGGAAAEAGLACAASVAAGTGGGGGGAGADTAEKPARNFSSLYFAFVRSAIRLCVSFSRSAVVNARLGGGGTVARFG
jgi:hypothetical protein